MKAMILAAGYGTRLWPLTVDRTKPAIPFLGKPLVGYVAEYLAKFGFNDVVVNLHHRPDSVQKALGDGKDFGVKLNYVMEEIILGTSGALDNAKHLLKDETFAVINGKIITDINLAEALKTHKESNAIATLVLLPNYKREKFTVVNVKDGLLVGFSGTPTGKYASDNAVDLLPNVETNKIAVNEDKEPIEEMLVDVPLMFTGIQFLEQRIFDYIPQGVFSHSTTDVYPKAMKRGEKIAVHIANGNWYELSTIERYLEICLLINDGKNKGIISGNRNEISKEADVSDVILWDDVLIEKGAKVKRAILGDGVRISSDEVIENAAVVRADLVKNENPPEKALKGEIRGENFVVSLTQ